MTSPERSHVDQLRDQLSQTLLNPTPETPASSGFDPNQRGSEAWEDLGGGARSAREGWIDRPVPLGGRPARPGDTFRDEDGVLHIVRNSYDVKWVEGLQERVRQQNLARQPHTDDERMAGVEGIRDAKDTLSSLPKSP